MIAQGSTQDRVTAVETIVPECLVRQKVKGVGLRARCPECVIPVGHIAQVSEFTDALPKCARQEEVRGGNGEIAPQQSIDGGMLGTGADCGPVFQNVFVHEVPPVLLRQRFTVFINQAHARGDEDVAFRGRGNLHQALQSVGCITVVRVQDRQIRRAGHLQAPIQGSV